jgi:hypothetical protein
VIDEDVTVHGREATISELTADVVVGPAETDQLTSGHNA